MKKIPIFVLAVLLLAPVSTNAAESHKNQEAIEALSNDVAGTWEAINTGLTNTHVNALAIDPSNPSIIYAGTDGGVFKSTDGGDSWRRGGCTDVIYSLAIDPSNPNRIYACGNCLFGSADGGANWSNWTAIYGMCLVSLALAINPSNTTIVYEGNAMGLAEWFNNGGLNGWLLSGSSVYALAIDPSNPNIIYAGTGGGVYKTTNGGESWNAINSGLTNTDVFALTIDPSSPNIVYAGTDDGVFQTPDGGENWNAINSGLTNAHVLSLAIDPINTGIIYAGTDGGGVFKFSPAEGSPSLHVSKSGTGHGTVTSTPPGISCGQTCQADFTTDTSVTLTASAEDGSIFTGWSGGGCSGTGPCTITVSSYTAITASFALVGNCAYTISPENKTLNAKGGSVSIKVSATGQTNCPAPLVVEDAEWISVSGTPTWKGNKGTIKIAVQKNPSSQSRTGVVSIGSEDLTIEQGGAICQLKALKPSSGKYSNAGKNGSFDIKVSPQDCGWNVSTTFDWIHLDTTTGQGNGTAAFHLDANGTGKNRTGKINISLTQNATKKKTFTVNENK